ncbi:MAG: phosphatidylglycerophosphatase A [Aeromonadales bacterium]|nr:phosphatidylglycerophosphatase A [Aeromonadales bacterium]
MILDKHDRQYLNRVSLKNPWHFLALGFGSGLLPKAPGTYGSLAALPICMILVYLPWYVTMAVILVTFFVGWYASSVTEKAMGMHDNSAIVVDEFVGMFISVLFYPSVYYYTILAFILFRFFDVLKPFPISYADKKVSGGLGVMLDDVLAGIAALATAHAIFYFI